jgi:tRNA wybutosine-synthesizing protein 1
MFLGMKRFISFVLHSPSPDPLRKVVQFCKELEVHLGGEYGIASEHEHSCCVLLAKKSEFLIDDKWHTWIDFEKFQDLVASGTPFTVADYILPTPQWAVFGSSERGFDPEENRMKSRQPYQGSGC